MLQSLLNMQIFDPVRRLIRLLIRKVAGSINRISRGSIHADLITSIGAVAHVLIAWLIAVQQFIPAAILLVFFGLFDTLDGELARLQGLSSPQGMLLDASMDRLKEASIYVGIVFVLAHGGHPLSAAFAAAACGASLSVSYVKAKGEAAIASQTNMGHEALNRFFKEGILTFELRMILIIIGLLFNRLAIVSAFIAILAFLTVIQRLLLIRKRLVK